MKRSKICLIAHSADARVRLGHSCVHIILTLWFWKFHLTTTSSQQWPYLQLLWKFSGGDEKIEKENIFPRFKRSCHNCFPFLCCATFGTPFENFVALPLASARDDLSTMWSISSDVYDQLIAPFIFFHLVSCCAVGIQLVAVHFILARTQFFIKSFFAFIKCDIPTDKPHWCNLFKQNVK